MQAVPLSARKAGSGSSDGVASLLQLPNFNDAVITKIAKKVSIFSYSDISETFLEKLAIDSC